MLSRPPGSAGVERETGGAAQRDRPRLSRIAIFGIPGLNAAQFAATDTAVRALALEAEIMEVRVGSPPFIIQWRVILRSRAALV
jgi:hypothetical protein